MNKGRMVFAFGVLFVALSLQAGRTRRKHEKLSPQEERRLLTKLARAENKDQLTEKEAAKLYDLRSSVEKNKPAVAPQERNFDLPPQEHSDEA